MRGTLIGRHATYGSSCSLRLSLSSFAHGSSGSSPGFNPPSCSMSAFEPPPSHGPVRSGWPSGSRRHRTVHLVVGNEWSPARRDARDPILRVRLDEQRECRPRTVVETTRILFTTAPLGIRLTSPFGSLVRPPRRHEIRFQCFFVPPYLRGAYHERASEIDLSAELEHPAAEDLQRPQPLASVRAGVARGHVEHVARVEQVVEVPVSSHPQLRRRGRSARNGCPSAAADLRSSWCLEPY